MRAACAAYTQLRRREQYVFFLIIFHNLEFPRINLTWGEKRSSSFVTEHLVFKLMKFTFQTKHGVHSKPCGRHLPQKAKERVKINYDILLFETWNKKPIWFILFYTFSRDWESQTFKLYLMVTFDLFVVSEKWWKFHKKASKTDVWNKWKSNQCSFHTDSDHILCALLCRVLV